MERCSRTKEKEFKLTGSRTEMEPFSGKGFNDAFLSPLCVYADVKYRLGVQRGFPATNARASPSKVLGNAHFTATRFTVSFVCLKSVPECDA